MNSATSERQILNLLHRYAECVDDGDFDAVSELFSDADYHMAGPGSPPMRGSAVGDTMRRVVRTYGGVPRTKHVISNEIIEIDDATGSATSRSYFTVLQAVEGALELQPITAGRYHDRFERRENTWHFADRSIVIEFVGDMSAHLLPGII
jgi:3-phenylpropionate/cinnamic acid dioxygenase small subunit